LDDARIVHKDIKPTQGVSRKADDARSGGLIHVGEIRLNSAGFATTALISASVSSG